MGPYEIQGEADTPLSDLTRKHKLLGCHIHALKKEAEDLEDLIDELQLLAELQPKYETKAYTDQGELERLRREFRNVYSNAFSNKCYYRLDINAGRL